MTYRVVHGERGGWKIERENASRVVSSQRTRIEAILHGREMSLHSGPVSVSVIR